jgi:hypothetical protein
MFRQALFKNERKINYEMLRESSENFYTIEIALKHT